MRDERGAAGVKKLTVELPLEIHKQLKVLCAETGASMGELVQWLIERHVKAAGKEKHHAG